MYLQTYYCFVVHGCGFQYSTPDLLDSIRLRQWPGHSLFAFIVMLEHGGRFPSAWGNADVMTWECIDKANAATIELQRVKD